MGRNSPLFGTKQETNKTQGKCTHWNCVRTSWFPGPGSVSPAGRCAAAGLCSAGGAGGLEPGPPAEPWPRHSAGPSRDGPTTGEARDQEDGHVEDRDTKREKNILLLQYP